MGIEADGPERPPHDIMKAILKANTASHQLCLLAMIVLRQKGVRLGLMARVIPSCPE